MKSHQELDKNIMMKMLEEQESTIISLEQALQICKQENFDNIATHRLVQSQLREANENLVIASIHAQTMLDIAEQAKTQMSHMAKHDTLTNLPNRLLLNDRLMQSMTF